jgi:hypothetical protein
MLTIAYRPNVLIEDPVRKEMKREHAFEEAKLLLDSHATSKVYLYPPYNFHWVMMKTNGRYLMRGQKNSK